MKIPEYLNWADLLEKAKKNTKAIFIAAVILLFLDGVTLLRMQMTSLGGLFSEARKLKSDIGMVGSDTRSGQNYKKRVRELKESQAAMEKMVLSEDQLPAVLETISKYADISALRILKIKPLGVAMEQETAGQPPPTLDGKPLVRQEVSITARAGFHDFGRFMALIENSEIYFDTKSLEIRSDSSDETKHKIGIVLELIMRKT